MSETEDIHVLVPIHFSVRPPHPWEEIQNEILEGRPTSTGDFVIQQIPFFARNLAVGDVIRTKPDPSGRLQYQEVRRSGGHATYRVYAESAQILDEIQALICPLEVECVRNAEWRLMAIDVPSAGSSPALPALQGLLRAARLRREIDFEDSQIPKTVPEGFERDHHFIGMKDDDAYTVWRRTKLPLPTSDPDLASLRQDLNVADFRVADLMIPLISDWKRFRAAPCTNRL